MSIKNTIKAPTKREKITIRLLVLLGILSIVNFFFWFLNPDLIASRILFGLLIISMLYDSFRLIYIWYHYWNISIPKKPVLTKAFTVDVLTTYFPGEPYEMVEQTLQAIQRMKYPHTTYLCDEADDEYLKAFCAKNDIIHVTRTNRVNAKAGNINNALRQAKGDICLILDPDHVPNEDFLDEVVPFFENEKVGFVQTVQAYYNIDQSSVAKGAAQQTFHFYGPVMMSMNHYGTVNAIGANCVFRRKALDSIGGHAPGLSEDMHTAMQLHAKGWKSVYVPQVFTKGLVPATITAYYKQQLKWSRGTLDLLVNVYPKLFTKFTRRQKLHYGILPFHYISGIIYLINFLVPIISLFFAITPWKGNVVNFALIFAPVFISIMAIRIYIQRWLMYKSERGSHLIGGVLQSCTWWIYVVGFVYTLVGKKVPYLPTPKDDKVRTSWKILVPNLLVGFLSVAAVIYGLSIDFTPFSIFMSGFALLNASFMFYTVYLAYEKPKVVPYIPEGIEKETSVIDRLKDFLFEMWHKFALPVVIVLFAILASFQRDIEYDKWQGVTPEIHGKHTINYLGIFSPTGENGISDLKVAKQVANEVGEHFDIISLYLAWQKDIDSEFPKSIIDSIYQQKSLAMITWEPWLNSFESELQADKKHVFELITAGYFDSYIENFSRKLKEIQHPVFLRFAHEFDNPFYPWYVDSVKAPLFKSAWIHTYEIFKKNGAENVIWVWNPWKPSHVVSFYPGKEYVDWIGVNILNYGRLNSDKKWHEFDELYQPFHDEFQDLPSTPVIISEFGTLNGDPRQNTWISNAFDAIRTNYSEIKSLVYFNSKVDKNWPDGIKNQGYLDWSISKEEVVKNSFRGKQVPAYVFSRLPLLISQGDYQKAPGNGKLRRVVGVNLKKGHNWWRDYHVLDRKHLLQDFEKMKSLGINTVKFEENSVYQHNVLNIARKFNLSVSIGFWIPSDIDFVTDSLKARKMSQNILEKVEKLRKDTIITSWNIQNDVLFNQKDVFHKPELLFQNMAYYSWLKDLIGQIKRLDPVRPVIVDLEVNRQSIRYSKMLSTIPGLDFLGLVVKQDKFLPPLLEYLQSSQTKFLYSEIKVNTLTQPGFVNGNTSYFVTAWQDTHEVNKLSFNGVIDWKGRLKNDFFKLENFLQGDHIQIDSAQIAILKPAVLLYGNMNLDFYAMCYNDFSGWQFGNDVKDVRFEWSLIKCDDYGNYLAIRDIGRGGQIKLKIPSDYRRYRLVLTAKKGDFISSRVTTLNTPQPEIK